MTELTQYQQPNEVALPSIIQTAAKDMNGAMTVANGIVGTSFVPQHFRGKPEEAAAAILYGATLGFDPLTSLQQLYSIGGKPALYSRAMVAVVLSKGHRIWTVEDSPDSVTVAGQRKGSDNVEQITWTIERAKTAGYTSNKNYQRDPHAMLYARASGDVARRIAPDALLGLAYSAEELQLGEGEGTVSTQRVTADQFVKPDPAPTAGTKGQGELRAAIQGDTGEAPSDAQLRKMFATLKENGLEGRDEALGYVAETIGRPIESRNELTRQEVSTVLDSFTPAPEEN